MSHSIQEINEKLKNKFRSHKYEICNSYIYNWESDFFSVSSTGYAQEIEIKLSYSDFKADFIKVSKHNLLRSAFLGKKKYCWVGNAFYNVKGFYNRRGQQELFERTYERSNKSSETEWRKRGWEFEQMSSEIKIREVETCPNKFWYCCPTGIIPIHEVPEYAGLYYFDHNLRMTVKKKAPFIHKEKQDLTSVLLDKFYWQSKKLEHRLTLEHNNSLA